MMTTVELSGDLLERSKAVARRQNTTHKALIEEGPRLALAAKACGGVIHDARITAICLSLGAPSWRRRTHLALGAGST
jgi:hypothetical protein